MSRQLGWGLALLFALLLTGLLAGCVVSPPAAPRGSATAPAAQVQVKLSRPSVQVPPCSHGFGAQSSTSVAQVGPP